MVFEFHNMIWSHDELAAQTVVAAPEYNLFELLPYFFEQAHAGVNHLKTLKAISRVAIRTAFFYCIEVVCQALLTIDFLAREAVRRTNR